MPIYEFECSRCEDQFEELMRLSDPDPDCPACGAQVRKLISNTSFKLKGSGWYATDYASPPASSGREESSESSEKSGATDHSSTGKKTASGSETESSAT